MMMIIIIMIYTGEATIRMDAVVIARVLVLILLLIETLAGNTLRRHDAFGMADC
jgi:hypothetical protein